LGARRAHLLGVGGRDGRHIWIRDWREYADRRARILFGSQRSRIDPIAEEKMALSLEKLPNQGAPLPEEPGYLLRLALGVGLPIRERGAGDFVS
jgi:hypothetical protein